MQNYAKSLCGVLHVGNCCTMRFSLAGVILIDENPFLLLHYKYDILVTVVSVANLFNIDWNFKKTV